MSKSSLRYPELVAAVAAFRAQARVALLEKIITVMSPKGGQGKSFFAKELAWLFDAILLDLDWDGGRVSRLLGYLAAKYKNVPLLDALEDVEGNPPRLYRSNRRPDMVPGHKDFEANQPPAEKLAELMISWTRQYKRTLVADTHPGGSPSTLGAAAAADLVVMPVVLGTGELDAVEEALEDLAAFNVLLVPNWVGKTLPFHEARRLALLAHRWNVKISAVSVHRHTWMTPRKIRTVISAAPDFGVQTEAVTLDMLALGKEILTHV